MSHECEICGQECYCDMDDCGGMEQPPDCRHFLRHGFEDEIDHDELGEELERVAQPNSSKEKP